jgi:VIT1/CCC1 family predicted Fe2+/Mn2+ transporter
VLELPATFEASTLMTGMTFFFIGSLRSRWSPAPWWSAGLETFAIGMSAAIIAYAVGVLLGDVIQ